MRKITFVISDIDKALAFEWLYKGLYKEFDLHFILLSVETSRLEDFLVDRGASVERIDHSGGYIISLLRIRRALKKSFPEIVHCHLRSAEILGIPAAWSIGIKKRIYTRHSSTYNHLYHKKGVLVDKLINGLATHIVAVSENVREVLVKTEKTKGEKVITIPHGFDLSIFGHILPAETQKIRDQYHIPVEKIVIGVIARYTWWKGFRYLIPAFKRYLETYPDAHFVFSNAKGNNQKEIRELMYHLLPEESVTEIEFEENVPALYSVFDYYVHVPFDPTVEAFGQTYIEALASEIPSVFTLSGIGHEFIVDQENAMVVPHQDSEAIYMALKRLREDETLRQKLIRGGRKAISSYTLDTHFQKLKELYNG